VGEVARHVNDLLPDYRRQALKPYIPRLIDTNDRDSVERARLCFIQEYIIEELFPLGLEATGLDFLIPVLRRVAPNHVIRLKPYVNEIVGQALRDPSWPEVAMTILQSRIERGLWGQSGTAVCSKALLSPWRSSRPWYRSSMIAWSGCSMGCC